MKDRYTEEFIAGIDGIADEEGLFSERKLFVLIIYDIIENKRRTKFAKLLQGYGFRIQRSSFEAVISLSKYEDLMRVVPKYVSEEDSVRVYRLRGENVVKVFGRTDDISQEDVIVI